MKRSLFESLFEIFVTNYFYPSLGRILYRDDFLKSKIRQSLTTFVADAYVTEPISFLSLRGKKVDATLASNFFCF